MIRANHPNYLTIDHGDRRQTLLTNEGEQVCLQFILGTMSIGQHFSALEVAAIIVWLQQWEMQQEGQAQHDAI